MMCNLQPGGNCPSLSQQLQALDLEDGNSSWNGGTGGTGGTGGGSTPTPTNTVPPGSTATNTPNPAHTATSTATIAGNSTNTPTATSTTIAPTNTPTPSVATGSILRERWDGVTGTSIAELRTAMNAGAASFCGTANSFEAPTNVADNYGTRMRGLLVPSVTGSYTFAIAGDDNVELYLNSSGSAPAGATRIAFHNEWTNPQSWTTFPSQTSGTITLTAGQTYYIEALQKEGGGGDNLAVGWRTPSNSTMTVIPGSNLSSSGFTCPNVTPTQTPTATQTATTAPTSTPTHTLTPTATATTQPPYVIYANSALASGWVDWSWNTTRTFSATGQYASSPNSIRLSYDSGWAGLYLSLDSGQPSISGSYNTLRFSVRGGNYNGPHSIQILLYTASGNTNAGTITAVRNEWNQYEISIASVGLSNLRGIAFQENTNASRGNFFIDDIQLVRR
jgi:hypothetical protein